MIRKIVVPTENSYILVLPDEMIGREVEILAFSTHEGFVDKPVTSSQKPNNLREIFEDVRVDLSGFKFNREEANDYE
ncbi:hypothetical protein [Dyadobacter sandarakinus]|uniref:Uncharacterized protein n=1 Tax=Dyadobacter sandarakinus TaxID=2747268 RepID=A0ABX7I6B5_9BACT|nr:hypothetical protein [Dyadobacter sandarakinus]QRR01646.1 hypothetical protein HWI92_12390 [Dyadobacter sandarakinus]